MQPPDSTAKQIADRFPIESQTRAGDKACLLGLQKLLAERVKNYNYIEIGSFMGGSLAPFVIDSNCRLAFSVDERERQQPDDRGAKFDYAGITSQTMLRELKSHGLDVSKVVVHDGSINTLKTAPAQFDLGFIDGEHTDHACFRDFLWLQPLMKPDCIIAFHDNVIIHRALRMIRILLEARGTVYKMLTLRKDSSTTIIAFGNYVPLNLSKYVGTGFDFGVFFDAAEASILRQQVMNRVLFDGLAPEAASVTVNPPEVKPAF